MAASDRYTRPQVMSSGSTPAYWMATVRSLPGNEASEDSLCSSQALCRWRLTNRSRALCSMAPDDFVAGDGLAVDASG